MSSFKPTNQSTDLFLLDASQVRERAMTTGLRKCSNCFELKPKTEFYRKLNGLQSRCKSCNAEVVCAYQKRRKEKERDLRDMELLKTLEGAL